MPRYVPHDTAKSDVARSMTPPEHSVDLVVLKEECNQAVMKMIAKKKKRNFTYLL